MRVPPIWNNGRELMIYSRIIIRHAVVWWDQY